MVRELISPLVSSRTLSYVSFLAVLVGLYSVLPVWKEHSRFADIGDAPSQVHAALTLVLGWLLVFRTTTAHARWWEARTLWGGLVNASRNLAIKFTQLVQLPLEELSEARRDLVAFPFSLRDHLRDEDNLKSHAGFEQRSESVAHVPSYLVALRYEALRRWKRAGWIDGDELRVLDRELALYLDICGGCERIRRTRIIGSYRLFARQCVIAFLLTLPWGIVNDFLWWTIPITTITAYFMLGLEIVAEHVEEPFGRDEDDLDLDGICKTIESSLTEIFARARSSASKA